MISRDLGNGFRAVPRDAVTLNGIPLPQLNTQDEPYDGPWVLIAPNGYAVDGEENRPYVYRHIGMVKYDAARLTAYGEYSTCGGIVTKDAVKGQPTGDPFRGYRRAAEKMGKPFPNIDSFVLNTFFVSTTFVTDAIQWLSEKWKDLHIEFHEDRGWQVSTCYADEAWDEDGWVRGDGSLHSALRKAIEVTPAE